MPKCQILPLPVSPIEKLAVKFQDYLYLPDPGPLQVLMGSVAANMTRGVPVWLMMIGSPSCGKTELLNALLDLPNQIELTDISSEAAFLSATPDRERSKIATGGILRQIGGDKGGVVLNDFTTILSRPERMTAIMATLREVYNGRYTRHVGSEGGRQIQWVGRLAAYAGCTPEIDQHHSLASKMGERWINYRFDPREQYYASSRCGFEEDRPEEWRKDLSLAVSAFFNELGLSYRDPAPRRAFDSMEQTTLYRLADFCVHCRSGVPRDGYSHEINGMPETEIPTRLSFVLAQLLDGLDKIGVPAPARWRLLLKICLDSMPRLRRVVVEAVQKEPLTVEELTVPMGCSLSTAKRVVQDLEAHKVTHRTRGKVALTDWVEASYSCLLRLTRAGKAVTMAG